MGQNAVIYGFAKISWFCQKIAGDPHRPLKEHGLVFLPEVLWFGVTETPKEFLAWKGSEGGIYEVFKCGCGTKGRGLMLGLGNPGGLFQPR